jgi:hypothetical protein
MNRLPMRHRRADLGWFPLQKLTVNGAALIGRRCIVVLGHGAAAGYRMLTAMKSAIRLSVLVLLLAAAWGQTAKPTKTDEEIKQAIIGESIASYRGNCPCPYNTDRAGHRCGRRSAYSRPGGASPVCYPGDVTQKMVDDYRKGIRMLMILSTTYECLVGVSSLGDGHRACHVSALNPHGTHIEHRGSFHRSVFARNELVGFR